MPPPRRAQSGDTSEAPLVIIQLQVLARWGTSSLVLCPLLSSRQAPLVLLCVSTAQVRPHCGPEQPAFPGDPAALGVGALESPGVHTGEMETAQVRGHEVRVRQDWGPPSPFQPP